MAKAKRESTAPPPPAAGPARQVTLTQTEVQQTRELLESVMTIAAHGILYRVGQILGERLVKEAKLRGGRVPDTAAVLLVERGWALEVRFFAQKAQIRGSLEAKQAPEPTCHVLRGLVHAIAADEGGIVTVREEACASQGAELCTFAVHRGPR